MKTTLQTAKKNDFEIALEAEKYGGYYVRVYENRCGIWYTVKESKPYADKAKAMATFKRYSKEA